MDMQISKEARQPIKQAVAKLLVDEIGMNLDDTRECLHADSGFRPNRPQA